MSTINTLTRLDTLRYGHFKHLVIRCCLHRRRPLRLGWQLKGHALTRSYTAGAGHHDFLVVNHHAKLLTRLDVGRHGHHKLLWGGTWGCDNQPVPRLVFFRTLDHHLLPIDEYWEMLAWSYPTGNGYIKTLIFGCAGHFVCSRRSRWAI